jgi:hypothetical protein
MNDDDVWGGEMPNLPFRRRHGDPADEQQLDALLEAGNSGSSFDATFVANFGVSEPSAPAPEWQSVSDLLRAAANTASVDPSERANEADVLAAFRRERAGIRNRQPQPIARYKTMLSTRLTALRTGRLAAGLVAGVVMLTGAATAAYACVLPGPIQNFAHDTIGAPAHPGGNSGGGSSGGNESGAAHASAAVLAASAVKSDGDDHESKHDSDDPSSPAVVPTVKPTPTPTNSAAAAAAAALAAKKAAAEAAEAALKQKLVVYHLCREFATASANGKTLNAADLAVLVKAAGTAANIAAYCASLPVLPVACPSVTSTASATATAKPNDGDRDDLMKHWGPWCGICPQVKGTATATVTPTATPTATDTRHGQGWAFGLWCGGLGHHVDPKVIPLPTAAAGLDSRHGDGDHDGDDIGTNGTNGTDESHGHR